MHAIWKSISLNSFGICCLFNFTDCSISFLYAAGKIYIALIFFRLSYYFTGFFFFHHFPLKERISNFWFIPSCSQAFSSVFSDFPLLLQCRGSPSDYTWDIFIPRCPTMEIYNIFNACLHPLLLQHLLCFFITSSKDLGRKKLHRSSFHKEATLPNRTGAALAFILSSLLCLVSCLVWEETESFGNSLHNLLMRPLLPCPLYSGSFFNFCCLVWFNDTSLLWKPPVQQQEHSPPSA